MNLNGISAVVTGGASGLGEATSVMLSERGARVVVVDLDRQAAAGEALARRIGGAWVACDVRQTEQVQHAVDVAGEMAPLRALVNCAGIGWPERTIDRQGTPHSLETWERVIGINLTGTFNCIRLAASAMSKNDPDEDGQRGAIVNTASVAASDGQIGQAAYAASKGGIVSLTLVVARDLAAAGIRCNTIAPGLIDTPIYDAFPDPAQFKAALGKSVLFPPRLGRPEEYASLACELLANGYMNAETIRIDGGIRMPPKS